MTSRDFAFWLQGYIEITKGAVPSKDQWKVISNHLNLVFKHEIDPSMPDPNGQLQNAHDGANSEAPLVEPVPTRGTAVTRKFDADLYGAPGLRGAP
jgi:hypothetical protein